MGTWLYQLNYELREASPLTIYSGHKHLEISIFSIRINPRINSKMQFSHGQSIIEWFGVEGSSRISQFQRSCPRQGTFKPHPAWPRALPYCQLNSAECSGKLPYLPSLRSGLCKSIFLTRNRFHFICPYLYGDLWLSLESHPVSVF